MGQDGSRRSVDLSAQTCHESERIVVERREKLDATEPLDALCESCH